MKFCKREHSDTVILVTSYSNEHSSGFFIEGDDGYEFGYYRTNWSKIFNIEIAYKLTTKQKKILLSTHKNKEIEKLLEELPFKNFNFKEGGVLLSESKKIFIDLDKVSYFEEISDGIFNILIDGKSKSIVINETSVEKFKSFLIDKKNQENF